jgi:Na+/proline symporter
VFIAAMMAATMTTLSTVYNMVSSIISHDIYKGMYKPDLDDKGLLKAGRIAAFSIGLVVMSLAIVFVNSKFGIFNLMQAFFTLFNIPVAVPIAFGLIYRRIPKWSAAGAITWGLIVGATTRYLLNWDIGPQVYLSFVVTFGVLVTSPLTGRLYARSKLGMAALCAVIAAAGGLLFAVAIVGDPAEWQRYLAIAAAIGLGASLYGFSRLFSLETEEDRRIVAEFFRKVDTPIDVAKEVYGAGKRQVSTLPLVGRTIIFLGLLVAAAFFTTLTLNEAIAVGAMTTILLGFGSFMWLAGKKGEREEEAERALLAAK